MASRLNVLLLPALSQAPATSCRSLKPGSACSATARPETRMAESRSRTVTVLVVRPATPESAGEVDAHVRRVTASGIGVRFHHLPAVEPPADCGAGDVHAFKSRYLELHKPHVEAAARELGAAVLVVDFFATTVVLDVSRDLSVPTYVYFTSTAALLALMLRLPALDEAVRGVRGHGGRSGHAAGARDGHPGAPGLQEQPQLHHVVRVPRHAFPGRGRHIIVNTVTVSELEPGILAAIAERVGARVRDGRGCVGVTLKVDRRWDNY